MLGEHVTRAHAGTRHVSHGEHAPLAYSVSRSLSQSLTPALRFFPLLYFLLISCYIPFFLSPFFYLLPFCIKKNYIVLNQIHSELSLQSSNFQFFTLSTLSFFSLFVAYLVILFFLVMIISFAFFIFWFTIYIILFTFYVSIFSYFVIFSIFLYFSFFSVFSFFLFYQSMHNSFSFIYIFLFSL